MLHRVENEQDICNARQLIDCFANSFCRLYDGSNRLTFTFHCIAHHLVDDVVRHGSLVGHSMFSIEGAFGVLIRSLNGTRGLTKQIIESTQIESICFYYYQITRIL